MKSIQLTDQSGKIQTNIRAVDLVKFVNEYAVLDLHKWDCWKCEKIYDLEPEPNKRIHACPFCKADVLPF